MNRLTFYLVVPAVIAAVSIVNALAFALSRYLSEQGAIAIDVAAGLAILVVVAAFVAATRGMHRGRWVRLVLALIVILVAGFAPRLVDAYFASVRAEEEQAEGADMEAAFQVDLLARSDDIAARAAAARPFSGAEAFALLEFAADADLSARGLFDHTPETFDLVSEAIAGKVLDPNAPVAASPTGAAAAPLTLAFYARRIVPAAPGHIARHDWELLQLLATSGADLDDPAAAALRADLAREVVAGEGRFIALR